MTTRPCPWCDATGTVVENGEQVICPVCNGLKVIGLLAVELPDGSWIEPEGDRGPDGTAKKLEGET